MIKLFQTLVVSALTPSLVASEFSDKLLPELICESHLNGGTLTKPNVLALDSQEQQLLFLKQGTVGESYRQLRDLIGNDANMDALTRPIPGVSTRYAVFHKEELVLQADKKKFFLGSNKPSSVHYATYKNPSDRSGLVSKFLTEAIGPNFPSAFPSKEELDYYFASASKIQVDWKVPFSYDTTNEDGRFMVLDGAKSLKIPMMEMTQAEFGESINTPIPSFPFKLQGMDYILISLPYVVEAVDAGFFDFIIPLHDTGISELNSAEVRRAMTELGELFKRERYIDFVKNIDSHSSPWEFDKFRLPRMRIFNQLNMSSILAPYVPALGHSVLDSTNQNEVLNVSRIFTKESLEKAQYSFDGNGRTYKARSRVGLYSTLDVIFGEKSVVGRTSTEVGGMVLIGERQEKIVSADRPFFVAMRSAEGRLVFAGTVAQPIPMDKEDYVQATKFGEFPELSPVETENEGVDSSDHSTQFPDRLHTDEGGRDLLRDPIFRRSPFDPIPGSQADEFFEKLKGMEGLEDLLDKLIGSDGEPPRTFEK